MASLKRPVGNQILTVQSTFSFLQSRSLLKKLNSSLFLQKISHKFESELAERYQEAQAVNGKQQFYRFVSQYDPIGVLKVYKLSVGRVNIVSVKKNVIDCDVCSLHLHGGTMVCND